MEHQKLTLRGCLGLIVFTLSLLLGFWLVVKFDMCPFVERSAGIGLGSVYIFLAVISMAAK